VFDPKAVPGEFKLIDEAKVKKVSKAISEALDLKFANDVKPRLERLQENEALVDEIKRLERRFVSEFGPIAKLPRAKVDTSAQANLERIERLYEKVVILDELEGLYEALKEPTRPEPDDALPTAAQHAEKYKNGDRVLTKAEKAIWKDEVRLQAHFEARLRALRSDKAFDEEYLKMKDHRKWLNKEETYIKRPEKASTEKDNAERLRMMIDDDEAQLKRLEATLPSVPTVDPEEATLAAQYENETMVNVRGQYEPVPADATSKIPVAAQRVTSGAAAAGPSSAQGSKIPVPNASFPQRFAAAIKTQLGLLQELVKLEIRWKNLSRKEPEGWVYKDPKDKGPKKPPKPPRGGGQKMKSRPPRMLA
jgi:hypothetical protein